MKRYEVVDWKEHYENNRTRELKHMAWVPIPNKQDGDGYTELLDHPNGAAHFGAWNALLQVASKCDPRGSLLRDSGYPHDNVSLSRMTRIPEKVWNEALPRLVKIGWITFCDIPQDDASKPQDDAGECPRTEQKGTERKEKKGTIYTEESRSKNRLGHMSNISLTYGTELKSNEIRLSVFGSLLAKAFGQCRNFPGPSIQKIIKIQDQWEKLSGDRDIERGQLQL